MKGGQHGRLPRKPKQNNPPKQIQKNGHHPKSRILKKVEAPSKSRKIQFK